MTRPNQTTPYMFECVCGDLVRARPFTRDNKTCLNTYDWAILDEQFNCKCGQKFIVTGGVIKEYKQFMNTMRYFPFAVKPIED